jgi:hypothetical protein
LPAMLFFKRADDCRGQDRQQAGSYILTFTCLTGWHFEHCASVLARHANAFEAGEGGVLGGEQEVAHER